MRRVDSRASPDSRKWSAGVNCTQTCKSTSKRRSRTFMCRANETSSRTKLRMTTSTHCLIIRRTLFRMVAALRLSMSKLPRKRVACSFHSLQSLHSLSMPSCFDFSHINNLLMKSDFKFNRNLTYEQQQSGGNYAPHNAS